MGSRIGRTGALLTALAVMAPEGGAPDVPVPHFGPGKPRKKPVASSREPIKEHDCRQARRRKARAATPTTEELGDG